MPGRTADRHKNKLVVGVRNTTPETRDKARAAARAAGYSGLSEVTVAFWQAIADGEIMLRPARREEPALTLAS